MGAICTGADFDCGRGEEDLDRAERREAEEAVEATTLRQSAPMGEGRRRTSPRDADMTPRGCGSREQREPTRRGCEQVE